MQKTALHAGNPVAPAGRAGRIRRITCALPRKFAHLTGCHAVGFAEGVVEILALRKTMRLGEVCDGRAGVCGAAQGRMHQTEPLPAHVGFEAIIGLEQVVGLAFGDAEGFRDNVDREVWVECGALT